MFKTELLLVCVLNFNKLSLCFVRKVQGVFTLEGEELT